MGQRVARGLDALLETTILFSYSNIGYHLRRPTWDPTELQVDMTGRTCLVTGANSGLGYAVAEHLAALNATVVMLVRNRTSGLEAQAAVVDRTGNPHVELEVADLSDLGAVGRFADRFLERASRLDVLIHNVGVLLQERDASVDGIELTLATNVVGPFLLTEMLLPLMKKSAPSRVILVSSGGMYTQELNVSHLESPPEPFQGSVAYAQTKRAQVVLAELWAERWASAGVTINAMHPGWVDTPGLRRSLPSFHRFMRLILRSAPQGADTIVWLAVAQHLVRESGKFWFDRRSRSPHKWERTRESSQERQVLWQRCLALSQARRRSE